MCFQTFAFQTFSSCWSWKTQKSALRIANIENMQIKKKLQIYVENLVSPNSNHSGIPNITFKKLMSDKATFFSQPGQFCWNSGNLRKILVFLSNETFSSHIFWLTFSDKYYTVKSRWLWEKYLSFYIFGFPFFESETCLS